MSADPIDYLESEIDRARTAGQELARLPLDVAVALRDQLRPMGKAWAAAEATTRYQAQRRASARELVRSRLEQQRLVEERRPR